MIGFFGESSLCGTELAPAGKMAVKRENSAATNRNEEARSLKKTVRKKNSAGSRDDTDSSGRRHRPGYAAADFTPVESSCILAARCEEIGLRQRAVCRDHSSGAKGIEVSCVPAR